MLGVNPFTILCDKSGKNQLTDLSSCIIRVCHKGISFLRRYLPAGACIWRKQKSSAGGVAELSSLICGRLIKGGIGIGAEIPLCQILIMLCKDNKTNSNQANLLTLNNKFNTMTPEDYVSYPIALALKKTGFDWPCDHYYCAFDDETDVRFWSIHPAQSQNGLCTPNDTVVADAPTLWQAQKWLREKRRFQCQVLLNGVRSMFFWQVREMIGNGRCADSTHQYDVYEDAMSDCIAAALELIERKGE